MIEQAANPYPTSLPNQPQFQPTAPQPDQLASQQLNGYRTTPIQRTPSSFIQGEYRGTYEDDLNPTNLSKTLGASTSRQYKNKYSFKRLKPDQPSQTSSRGFEVKDYQPVRPTIVQLEREVNRPGGSTVINYSSSSNEQELVYLRERVREQQRILSQIREISYNRKLECERESTVVDRKCINTLVEIYNLSIVNTQLAKLSYLEENTYRPLQPVNITTIAPRPNINIIPSPSQPIHIPRPQPELRPIVPQSRPEPQLVPQTQPMIVIPQPQPQVRPVVPQPRPEPNVVPQPQPWPQPNVVPQPQPYVVPQPQPVRPQPQLKPLVQPEQINAGSNTLNIDGDKSQQYIREIRQLRVRIERLQLEKVQLIDKVRYYEKKSYDSSSNQDTVNIYREEIERLKREISEYKVQISSYSRFETQTTDLKEQIRIYQVRERELEEQLEEAQKHIIYLENKINTGPTTSPSTSHAELHQEIAELRKTISQYREHYEILEREKQDIEEIFEKREATLNSTIESLQTRIHQLNIQIQQGSKAEGPAVAQESGVDVEMYNSLVWEFGQKQLQSLLLLSEIQRLNRKNLEVLGFLQKAEDYIMELQNQQGGAGDNQRVLQLEQALEQEYKNQTLIKQELSQQIANYEHKLSQYLTTIHNLEVNINNYQTTINNYETTIHKYETTIHNYETPVNSSENKPSASSGVDKEAYEALVLENGKRTLQTVILMEEIYRLNVLYQQFRDHLAKAEDHIRSTQAYISELEMTVKTETFKSSQADTSTLKIKDLEGKITYLNQQIELFKTKEGQHAAELKKQEDKYKAIIDQLDKNYTELQKERNSSTSSAEVTTLKEQNRRLTIEVTEVTKHLSIAEEYIKQNSEIWQSAREAQDLLPEKLQIIDILKKDLEVARSQNKELHDRTVQLEQLIEAVEKKREALASSNVSSKSKETEHKLQNYIRLYNESQAQLHKAESHIETLQAELKQSSTVKVTTISSSSSSRTEEVIAEKEAKWNTQRQNYETELNQIKNHLMGAESYIRELEQQLQNLNKQYALIESQHKSQLKENENIHLALQQAEMHIRDMEKIIPKPMQR